MISWFAANFAAFLVRAVCTHLIITLKLHPNLTLLFYQPFMAKINILVRTRRAQYTIHNTINCNYTCKNTKHTLQIHTTIVEGKFWFIKHTQYKTHQIIHFILPNFFGRIGADFKCFCRACIFSSKTYYRWSWRGILRDNIESRVMRRVNKGIMN